ncbi:universal stress protein [Mariniflexile ostreae]|uniref:Universal stress protein n=1 Tax=Mariniflexile ostreae TaxID=1520892 RepID=A0ABV5F9Q4_9FLAO
MKNILLPTDFSENSWNAITYAIQFFKNSDCNFYLLHVKKPSDIVLDDAVYNPPFNDTKRNSHAKPTELLLQDIQERILKHFPKNKKHQFYTLIERRFFIESIRSCVVQKKIDIIVMGTKGATGLDKIIVGTNTADVITKVKCSTLAIPENARFSKLKAIAFPTDFSLTYNIQVLQPISDVLKNHHSILRIVHISKNETNLNDDQNKHKALLEDYFNTYQHSFHFLKSKKVEHTIQCFVTDKNINMIFMVAKNLNYFQQILFHSKIKEISYHTDIPFLVLHEKN